MSEFSEALVARLAILFPGSTSAAVAGALGLTSPQLSGYRSGSRLPPPGGIAVLLEQLAAPELLDVWVADRASRAERRRGARKAPSVPGTVYLLAPHPTDPGRQLATIELPVGPLSLRDAVRLSRGA